MIFKKKNTLKEILVGRNYNFSIIYDIIGFERRYVALEYGGGRICVLDFVRTDRAGNYYKGAFYGKYFAYVPILKQ